MAVDWAMSALVKTTLQDMSGRAAADAGSAAPTCSIESKKLGWTRVGPKSSGVLWPRTETYERVRGGARQW
eukprot:344807-Hanusia_phi.AAC.5